MKEQIEDNTITLAWTPNPPGCVGAMGAPLAPSSNAFKPCEVCRGYGFIATGDFPYRFDRCTAPKCGGSGQVYL